MQRRFRRFEFYLRNNFKFSSSQNEFFYYLQVHWFTLIRTRDPFYKALFHGAMDAAIQIIQAFMPMSRFIAIGLIMLYKLLNQIHEKRKIEFY